MSYIRTYVVALLIGAALIAAVLCPFAAIWGVEPTTDALDKHTDASDFVLLGIMMVSIVAHELLHGVGFREFGRIPRREVRYGFIWWAVLPYATSSGTLTVAAYGWTCLLPGIVLGAAPALLGVFVGHVPTMAYGAALLGVSAGDLVALWTTRDLSPSSLVRDNPRAVGCLVAQAVDGARAE